MERAIAGDAAGPTSDGAPFWQNSHAGIAIAAGVILLLVTYGFTGEHSFAHDASHEIGFALIVAVLIWFIFEVASRDESNRTWNDRIDRISRNVFFGVLGRNLSREVIEEARIVALDHAFERRELNVTYILADGTYLDRAGETRSFVKMRATTRFHIMNISNRNVIFPVSIGLPNPLINEMKSFCEIHRVCIRNGDQAIEVDLTQARAALKHNLENDDSYQVNVQAHEVELKPGDERVVILEYTMAKEDEDTELLQTRYPTRSLTVTLFDTSREKRLIRARSIHRLKLEEDEEGQDRGIYVYRLEKFLLPFQGFAIWWKKRPPTSTTQAESS